MRGPVRILLVDDEPDILEFMRYNLEKEGYLTFTAPDGKEALALAEETKPDLIILDVMMPVMDGVEACQRLRAKKEFRDTLIVFLTARGEDYSEVAGFESGADDYITKPIKPKVILSRIKALLRRKEGITKRVETGRLTIDQDRYEVKLDGKSYHFPPKEFELLALLASNPGKVFKRNEILHRIWGNDIIVGDRTIDVHIRRIRTSIGEESIKTVKGVGYKLTL